MLKNAAPVPSSVQIKNLEKNVATLASSKFKHNRAPTNPQNHYAPPKPKFGRDPKRKITAIVSPKNVC